MQGSGFIGNSADGYKPFRPPPSRTEDLKAVTEFVGVLSLGRCVDCVIPHCSGKRRWCRNLVRRSLMPRGAQSRAEYLTWDPGVAPGAHHPDVLASVVYAAQR